MEQDELVELLKKALNTIEELETFLDNMEEQKLSNVLKDCDELSNKVYRIRADIQDDLERARLW